MVFIGLILILTAADLLIKAEIESRDGGEFPKPLDKNGMITLHKSHNEGLPFGFLRKYQEAVKMIPIVTVSALGGILFWLLQHKGHLFEKLAFSTAIAGGLSNLYDRLVRHYVVDYFSISAKGIKKVIFNLGDIMIFTGFLMVMFHEAWVNLRTVKRKKN